MSKNVALLHYMGVIFCKNNVKLEKVYLENIIGDGEFGQSGNRRIF